MRACRRIRPATAEILDAMPQENVSPETTEDALRLSVEAINSRDRAAIEASCDPDLELTSSFSAVEGKTYLGYEGASDYLDDTQAAWEDFRITVEESIPAGDEKLVAVLRVTGTGRGSGVPFDQLTYGAYEFRGGKVWRARFSPSREEALEASGLRE
jgi:ketosteroid isomerase-like protein